MSEICIIGFHALERELQAAMIRPLLLLIPGVLRNRFH